MSRACVFLVDGRRFAIRAERVKEVVHLEHITPVPLTPPHVLGVSNLRGTILPVIDLRQTLALEATKSEPEASQITLSCEADDLQVGLTADEVVGIEDVPEQALSPMTDQASPALRRMALGSLDRAGEETVLLDIDTLIRDSKIVQPVGLAELSPVLAPAASPARREAWQ